MKAAALFCLALATAALAGCSRAGDQPKGEEPQAKVAAPSPHAGGTAEDARWVAMDFVAPTQGCSLGHRGVLLDLGDVSTTSRIARIGRGAPDIETRERDGASWLVVRERSLVLPFVASDELASDTGFVVEARMRGALAKSVSVYLDGKAIGKLALTKGDTRTAKVSAPSGALGRGAHELRLGFNGGPRTSREDLAEMDWIHIGPSDDGAAYAAPTRADAIATVAIGGVSKRSVLLRSPGFARCIGYVPDGATFEGAIGITGGRGEAEVRVLVDRQEPRTIGTFTLGRDETPAWTPISLPLGHVGTVASVELIAKSSTKGARIVFADPRVEAPRVAPVARKAPSRGVVVVILGTTSPRALSTYGGTAPSPSLDRLAAQGVVFDGHRATTSYANGSVASLLTGLQARDHGIDQPETKLDARVLTIAEAARQAGVVTAMFTANPTTSNAFGFAQGWETFATRYPNSHEPATLVFDDAAHWLDLHKNDRFFLVVHARGGHPPWDVTDDELHDLPPADYAGALEPKHAGEALAKARRPGGSRLFADADRERAFALYGRAIAAHDAALGRLVDHVKALGREGDTSWIVTGDVGFDPKAHVPFLEDDALDEAALSIPLVITDPSSGTAGGARSHHTVSTSAMDLSKTVLEMFGLPPPSSMHGESLVSVAALSADRARPLLATSRTRYSLRWAGLVLLGSQGTEGKFCSLAIEPDCISDIGPVHPLALEALRTQLFLMAPPPKISTLPASRPAPGPDALPATFHTGSELDPDTTRALSAWGR